MPNFQIPECAACGLPAVYQCKMTDDQYCTKHKKDCCYLIFSLRFPQPTPKYTREDR